MMQHLRRMEDRVVLLTGGGGGIARGVARAFADEGASICLLYTSARYVLRDLVLRMYWDDETEPSVESPLGDFFCCGFGTESTL